MLCRLALVAAGRRDDDPVVLNYGYLKNALARKISDEDLVAILEVGDWERWVEDHT
jgi:hypothetical protein